jgi:hypothetical protein
MSYPLTGVPYIVPGLLLESQRRYRLRRCAPLSQTLLSSMTALAMLQDAEPCHHRREEIFPDMMIFLKTMDFSLDMPKAARLYTCKTYITYISDKRSLWMTWMTAKLYKIKDVALRLDRSILTIKRWEKQGLIPKARKDSRGWRVYTEEEVQAILKKVRETNYFRNGGGTA